MIEVKETVVQLRKRGMERLQNDSIGDSSKAMTGSLFYSPFDCKAVLEQIPLIAQKLNNLVNIICEPRRCKLVNSQSRSVG
jgi:hypothetical protein